MQVDSKEVTMHPKLRLMRSIRWIAWAFAVATTVAISACGGGTHDASPIGPSDRSQKQSVEPTRPLRYTVVNLPSDGNGDIHLNDAGHVAGQTGEYEHPRFFFFDGERSQFVELPDGTSSALIEAFNDAGQVVFRATNSADEDLYVSFFWSPSSGLVRLRAGHVTGAFDINDAGTAAGIIYEREEAGTFAIGGFSWTEAGGFVLYPFAIGHINNGGQMLILSPPFELPYLDRYAFRDSDGSILEIGAGLVNVYPTALNDAGTVIGHLVPRTGIYIPFVWDAASGIDVFGSSLLSDPSDYAYVHSINQRGQAVGLVCRDVCRRFSGYLRNPDGELIDLGEGSHAADINDLGQVVGARGSSFLDERATLWDPVEGTIDLHTRLIGAPSGLHLREAHQISNDGSILAWTDTGYVLLKPDIGPAPAPASLSAITANYPVPAGTALHASIAFSDVNTSDTHAAQWSWGDSSPATPGVVTEATGEGSATGTHTYAAAGIYRIQVVVTDSTGRSASVARDVIVYDETAGFVTGAGEVVSPIGAYKADPTAMGRANFNFVSRYAKGATAPTGATQFRFQTANLLFRSDAYDWLVVAGARAQYKGTGTYNGRPGYKFLLTAVDGALYAEGEGADRFRIKIWHTDRETSSDVVDYDNQTDSSLEGGTNEGTEIHGAIVIHR